MSAGNLFEREISRFESAKSGYAALAEEILRTAAPAGESPSDAEVVAKRASAFLNVLMKAPWRRNGMKAEERDAVRCVILIFPFLPVDEIRRKGAQAGADAALLEGIAKACASAAGTAEGDGADSGSLPERTAAECVMLACSQETTDGLPEVEGRALKRAEREGRRAGYLDAVAIAREMTDGRDWDGCVYEENGFYSAVIDGQNVPVATPLIQAFLTIGEARKGRSEKKEKREEIFSPGEFLARHPGWNAVVYGTPGGFFIRDSSGEQRISDEQATAFGIRLR